MRKMLILPCFILSLAALAQDPNYADRKTIYQTLISAFADTGLVVVNETYNGITRYDIDGVSRNAWPPPVFYEQPVSKFLALRNIFIDTAELFSKIDHSRTDTLLDYISSGNIFNARVYDERYAMLWDKLLKTKRMTMLSNIIFFRNNSFALVKIQVETFRRPEIPIIRPPKQIDPSQPQPYNPSKIIILRKTGAWWLVWGVIDRLPPKRG